MKFTFGGGINELNDIAISPDEAVAGQNFELGLGNTKFKRRAAFDLLARAPNGGEVHGIHQLITRAGVKTTLVAADTDMYEWDGSLGENLLLWSEEFDHASWTKTGTGTVTPDIIVSPTGTTTADYILDNDLTPLEYRLEQAVTVANDSLTRTFSIYLQHVNTPLAAIKVEVTGGTPVAATGVITWSTGTIDVGTIDNLGDGWFRVSIPVTNNTSGNTSCNCTLYPSGTGVAGGIIYAWGAQLNVGALPQPYAQTEGSAVASPWTDVGDVDADSEFHHIEWDLDSTIIIVDRIKNEVILEWDGTTLSDLTHAIPAVTSFYAKYGIVQNGRMVFGNVTVDAAENPHMLVFSAFEDRESYDTTKRSGDASFTTGNEAFYILTPDLQPINGLIRFKRSTIVSTEGGQLFELIGDDSTNYRFEPFYGGSGAIGTDSFVNANDDVYYMRPGGVIESLRATVSFGDVGTDDISLPIRETVKNLTGVRAVYDQTNQKILFWTGSKVLVLYKNLIRSEKSPWSVYVTTHDSNFSTKAVVYMELAGSTNKTILFGDDSGNIYDLNGVGILGDAGTKSIQTIRKMPLQEFNYERFLEGRVFYRRNGECDLSITLEWGDEGSSTNLIVPIKGRVGASARNYFGGGATPIYFGGGDYFGEGDSVGNPVSKGFSAIGKGSSVFAEFQIDTVNEFEIDYIETPDE